MLVLTPMDTLEANTKYQFVVTDGVKDIASAITPVPGGVGPMTRAILLVNTVEAFRWRRQPPACPIE